MLCTHEVERGGVDALARAQAHERAVQPAAVERADEGLDAEGGADGAEREPADVVRLVLGEPGGEGWGDGDGERGEGDEGPEGQGLGEEVERGEVQREAGRGVRDVEGEAWERAPAGAAAGVGVGVIVEVGVGAGGVDVVGDDGVLDAVQHEGEEQQAEEVARREECERVGWRGRGRWSGTWAGAALGEGEEGGQEGVEDGGEIGGRRAR